MRYLWRDTAYELPDGLVDRSVVMLVDESSDEARLSITLAHDVLAAPSAAALAAYIDESIEETRVRVHALSVRARDAAPADGRDVVVLAQDVSAEPGARVHVAQAFVREHAAVTIVSVTADAGQAARARATLDGVVRSMTRVAA